MSEHIENIGDRGARRRRAGGVAWLLIGLVGAVLLIASGAPRVWRLPLVLAFALSANGFLQAREKT
ncbi:MAG TPA: hypothetical protein VIP11_18275 [Gemmatimonadaceae bacterium]